MCGRLGKPSMSLARLGKKNQKMKLFESFFELYFAYTRTLERVWAFFRAER